MSDKNGLEPAGIWNPSPERMNVYLEREVLVARSNIKKLWASGTKNVTPDSMLCSGRTFSRAMETLRADGCST